jgi:integral membrane sensor domain MASE1
MNEQLRDSLPVAGAGLVGGPLLGALLGVLLASVFATPITGTISPVAPNGYVLTC